MKKRLIYLLLIIVVLFAIIGCSKVPAGNVGIKVYLLGSKKGVDSEVLNVGRYWIGFNEELYLYPTFMQQYTFTQSKDDGDSPQDEAFYFQNKEGVKCSLDLAIQAYADKEKITVLFQKYREDLKEVIHSNLRNLIRDKIQFYASDMSIEDLYTSKKMEMIKKVEKDVQNEVRDCGIVIVSMSLLSDIRFPKEVEEAIVAKIKATQEALQRENEVQKAKADAQIKITNAEADAKSIALKQQSITQNLIQYEAVQKWNGQLPTYMMSNNSVPFVNLK